jgi:multisubunit Na+/H+ antiporter MnhB subunit
VGGYLFWSGAYAPGGAFQAGAVIGAGGVLLLLNGVDLPGRKKEWPLRLLLVLGFGLFLGVAAGMVAAGYRLLEYPRHLAGSLIVLIEAALTLSIAFVLAELFASSLSEGPARGIIPNRGKDEP